MTDLDFAIINTDGSNDDPALRYLAASLIAHWDDLPDDLRSSIYDLAVSGKIVGIPQTVQLKQQIDAILRRKAREDQDHERRAEIARRAAESRWRKGG